MSFIEKFRKEDDWQDEHGVSYESAEELLASHYFGACGCVPYDSILSLVRDVLRHFNSGKTWSDLVANHFGGIEAAAYLVVGILDDKFLEHGVAIRASWLTDDGKALLEDLEKLI